MSGSLTRSTSTRTVCGRRDRVPSCLSRVRAASLGTEFESVFRSAKSVLERCNGSETFITDSSVTRLLVDLSQTDGALHALWRCDYATNFFDKEHRRPSDGEYLAHLAAKPEIHHRRIMTYGGEPSAGRRDACGLPADSSERHVLRRPGSSSPAALPIDEVRMHDLAEALLRRDTGP